MTALDRECRDIKSNLSSTEQELEVKKKELADLSRSFQAVKGEISNAK